MTVMDENDKQLITFKEYSHQEILNMRKNGFPKPKDCSWLTWNRPLDLSPSEERICYLMAHGKSNKQIHEETGTSMGKVYAMNKNDSVLLRVKEIQHEVFGSNAKKRFDSLINDSINTISNIMRDPTASAGVRRGCANDILDRAMGKSIQQIEVRTSQIGDLYSKLDEMSESQNEIINVEYKEISEKDEIDEWSEENYKEENDKEKV